MGRIYVTLIVCFYPVNIFYHGLEAIYDLLQLADNNTNRLKEIFIRNSNSRFAYEPTKKL